MSASATVERTGELIELPDKTPTDVVASYRLVNETIEAFEKVKKQLQKRASELIDNGERLEHDGYMIRSYSTQRMAYDPAVLREVFDEDLMATFMEPQKGRIDRYLKEHLEELGPASTRLRESMVPTGRPYSVVRIERLDREAA